MKFEWFGSLNTELTFVLELDAKLTEISTNVCFSYFCFNSCSDELQDLIQSEISCYLKLDFFFFLTSFLYTSAIRMEKKIKMTKKKMMSIEIFLCNLWQQWFWTM